MTNPLKEFGKIYFKQLLEQPQIGFLTDSKLIVAVNYIDKDGNWILGEQVTITKQDLKNGKHHSTTSTVNY